MQKTNRHLMTIGRTKRKALKISPKTWDAIEQMCGIKVRPSLRLKYQLALNHYLRHGPGSTKMAPKSTLGKDMQVWAERTDVLRRKLSEQSRTQHRPKHHGSPKKRENVTQLLRRYFSPDRYDDRNITTDNLSFMLEGANRLSWSLWLGASRQKTHDPIEYWLAWVALLISLTRKDASIKVAWSNGGKKGIHKHFVHLVQELQKQLPSGFSSRRKFDSIHKGIILALPIAHQSPVFQLKSILQAWHKGDADFVDQPRRFPSMISAGRITERIKEQLAVLRRNENLTTPRK